MAWRDGPVCVCGQIVGIEDGRHGVGLEVGKQGAPER
jgi:hypothetical protein